MLRIKAFINSDEIDEIQIVNVRTDEKLSKKKRTQVCHYAIVRPHIDIKYEIVHARKDGWIPLVIKVLRVLKKAKYRSPR